MTGFSTLLQKCPPTDILTWPNDCFKLFLSSILSSAILAGSVALKLPQVLNILSTKEVVGLSPSAFYTEVPLSMITILYNYRLSYPFMAYGETVIIFIQNFILVCLLWQYSKPKPSVGHMLSVLAVFALVGVVCYHSPAEYLYLFPLTTLPLMLYARLVQIIANYQQGTTGQLSSITATLNLAGSLARIFTTIQDVGMDIALLTGFGSGAALSAILLAQVSLSLSISLFII
jgi:hypothetical protein